MMFRELVVQSNSSPSPSREEFTILGIMAMRTSVSSTLDL